MAPTDTAIELTAKENEDIWKKNQGKFNAKRSSEYYDPCQEAANRSIKCMNRNGGDKEMCQDYFQAYRDCKKEWMVARKEAKKAAGGGGWFS